MSVRITQSYLPSDAKCASSHAGKATRANESEEVKSVWYNFPLVVRCVYKNALNDEKEKDDVLHSESVF